MSSATGLIIESGDVAQDERDRVSVWRCEQLRRAGYSLMDALLLAVQHDIDLRLAVCSPRSRLSARDGASDPPLTERLRRAVLSTALRQKSEPGVRR